MAQPPLRLNQLLLEREAQFVRVHDLEQAATRILGEPYPFTRPALPSDTRSRRKTTASRPAPALRDRVRKLEPGESAYRVTYRAHDRVVTEDHDNPDALRTLLATQGAALAIVRIETVDTHGTPVATLFAAP